MLQEARTRWLGELSMQGSKLERDSRPRKVERGTSEVARRTCGAGKKVSSHGLADPARLQEARTRWLGELSMQGSKLERDSRPRKVERGTSEVARRTCGAGKHERGGSANFRCKEVNSNGIADPARLKEARARWLGELAVQEINSNGIADPARLKEARARWLGELAVQESKLARVSGPGKVARGTNEVARRTFDARK
ncbi:hypothetical protein CRG98_044509 [Punica granatum]|uniref:Uncharacterized protein n=1 Tax=Punica granatum TaxID=22663 RepID=A0A2I0HU23_PUNGR|nr:hypothetical protein CRG98_044509 [Punica granatum]